MKKILNVIKIFALSFISFFIIALLADEVFNFRCYQPLFFASSLVSLLFIGDNKTKSDV